jgi:ribonuclease E
VDSALGLKRIKQQLLSWNAGRLPVGLLIDHHNASPGILEYFRVNAAIREALKPRVDLPSGGYIVIERTEALTVIDVNSGSFTRSATARETVLWTNSEAATEIARQLRLRNIAGVIIVDFIDMDSRRDQLQVLEQFNKSLKADKARPQIAQLSELGLVELTRKRQGQNIYELFGRSCPTCGGLGHLVHLPGEPQTAALGDYDRSANRSEARGDGSRNEYRGNESRNNDHNNSRSRLPESAETRVDLRADDFSFSGEEPGQDLDLLNHPSYQERGGGRRRGRQQRSRESGRDPLPTRVSPRLVPVPAQTLPTLESAYGMTGLPAVPVPTGAGAEPQESFERRSGRRQPPRGKQEPPEIITVTMMAEEQQVYAAMGISPLILYSGEIKNPRVAVAAVALPGCDPMPLPPPPTRGHSRDDFPEDSGRELTTTVDSDSDLGLTATLDDGLKQGAEIFRSPSIQPTTIPDLPTSDMPAFEAPRARGSGFAPPSFSGSTASVAANVANSDGDGDSPDLSTDQAEPISEPGDDTTGPRRRRRRSSATGGEQLSLDT